MDTHLRHESPMTTRSPRPRIQARVLAWAIPVLVGAVANNAVATHTFDLASDFSNSSNPNGTWAFLTGTTLFAHQPGGGTGAPAPAMTDGFWGLSSAGFPAGLVFRATIASAQDPGYGPDDWFAGDVINYTPDSGAGPNTRITWTAPCDGAISYTGAAWYASTIVQRANNFSLTLNGGAPLAAGLLVPSITRSNAIQFASSAPIGVSQGDVLSLTFIRAANQQFGSFSGSILVIDFEPSVACDADLNGDCSVGAADLAIQLSAWGACAQCAADLNHDNAVDSADLAILLGAWGPCN